MSFLDISVSINGDALVTSISYKPTDSHSYLLFSSSHPNHTKQSIPYSQFLRLRPLCSNDKDFETKSLEMRTFFVELCGYPTHLLDSAIQKAFSNSRRDTLKPPLGKISDDKIPLVLTFHSFNYKVRPSSNVALSCAESNANSKILCLSSFTFDLAHEKFDV